MLDEQISDKCCTYRQSGTKAGTVSRWDQNRAGRGVLLRKTPRYMLICYHCRDMCGIQGLLHGAGAADQVSTLVLGLLCATVVIRRPCVLDLLISLKKSNTQLLAHIPWTFTEHDIYTQ